MSFATRIVRGARAAAGLWAFERRVGTICGHAPAITLSRFNPASAHPDRRGRARCLARIMFRATSAANLGVAKPLSSVEAVELRRRYTQILLAAGMLISGAANTLTCKQAFLTVSSGHVFNHPFVQAGAMFLGEVACLLFYLGSMRWRGKRVRWPPRHVLLGFAIPAPPYGQGRRPGSGRAGHLARGTCPHLHTVTLWSPEQRVGRLDPAARCMPWSLSSSPPTALLPSHSRRGVTSSGRARCTWG